MQNLGLGLMILTICLAFTAIGSESAFAEVIKIAPKLGKDTVCIVNSCGDAKKDRDILRKKLGKHVSN